jgi:hypothetical protein
MERTPKTVPKPCFGLEFDLSNAICQACTVQADCFTALGPRQNVIPLTKLTFDLVPPAFNLDTFDAGDDPELPNIERTYVLCFKTIFNRRPQDRIGQHKKTVINLFRQAKCSLRMFMLANMVGYVEQRKTIAAVMREELEVDFRASMLAQKAALKRVSGYSSWCRKSFGTFDLSSLGTLTDEDYADSDVDSRLHSEVTAAQALVGYKIFKGGSPWSYVYQKEEIALDPFWLALEPSYFETILKPYLDGDKGTKTQANHRFSVVQVIQQMKKQKDWAIALFQARERIMPKALGSVTHHWGFRPENFEIENKPVKDAGKFWIYLSRAIQHMECLRYVEGESSCFRR